MARCAATGLLARRLENATKEESMTTFPKLTRQLNRNRFGGLKITVASIVMIGSTLAMQLALFAA